MKFDVVCFGAMNVDTLYEVTQLARAEEEAEILGYKISAGGSAANTSVGLARLGVKTGYIGKVASDKNGKYLLRELIDEGVNTNGIVISESGRTGMVVGFVDREGQRALYLDPGENNSLNIKEIDLDYLGNTKILHLTSFAGNDPFISQKRVVEEISNTEITLDPGMLYARKGLKEMSFFLKRCKVIFPNEHEMKLLTGEGPEEGANILLKEGTKIVAVKLGRKGCYVTDGKEKYFVESFQAKTKDSTGAGDAFCAGFLYGLLNRKPLRKCGVLGNFVAAKKVEKEGARDGLPRRKELPDNLR